MSVPGLILPICKMGSTGFLRISSLPSLEPIVRRWVENDISTYPDKVGLKHEAQSSLHGMIRAGWELGSEAQRRNLFWRQIRLAVEIVTLGLIIEAMKGQKITQRLFKL